MRSSIRTFAALVVATSAVACSAAQPGSPEPDEGTTTTSGAIGLPTAPTSTSPTTNAPLGSCTEQHPQCTLTPLNPYVPTRDDFALALADTHQCGPEYLYQDHVADDSQHIGVALCNDVSAVRGIVKRSMWPYAQPFVAKGVCDACLAPAPSGKIYVMWTVPFFGPTCGGSCRLPWPGDG